MYRHNSKHKHEPFRHPKRTLINARPLARNTCLVFALAATQLNHWHLDNTHSSAYVHRIFCGNKERSSAWRDQTLWRSYTKQKLYFAKVTSLVPQTDSCREFIPEARDVHNGQLSTPRGWHESRTAWLELWNKWRVHYRFNQLCVWNRFGNSTGDLTDFTLLHETCNSVCDLLRQIIGTEEWYLKNVTVCDLENVALRPTKGYGDVKQSEIHHSILQWRIEHHLVIYCLVGEAMIKMVTDNWSFCPLFCLKLPNALFLKTSVGANRQNRCTFQMYFSELEQASGSGCRAFVSTLQVRSSLFGSLFVFFLWQGRFMHMLVNAAV